MHFFYCKLVNFKWYYIEIFSALSIRWCTSTCSDNVAPGRPGCHFKTAIFILVSLIGIFTSSNDDALRWIPWDLTDDKSTLFQVMAWCGQAASHYLSQCWPRSMLPYGVTRPQWVNRQQAVTWTNDGLVYWGMYASLTLEELTLNRKWVNAIETVIMPCKKQQRSICNYIMKWQQSVFIVQD